MARLFNKESAHAEAPRQQSVASNTEAGRRTLGPE
jgi:hypothetical protein